MFLYFSWWYGEGLVKLWQAIEVITAKVFASFSIGNLARTLFNPWKRDSYSVENASIDVRLRIWLDNAISRLIGALMRSVVILIGLGITILFFGFAIVLFIIWLSLPIVVIALIVNGVRVVING